MRIKFTILLYISLNTFVNIAYSQKAHLANISKENKSSVIFTNGKYALLPQPDKIYFDPVYSNRIINTSIGQFVISPNRLIHPSGNSQSTLLIVRSPVNEFVMFGSGLVSGVNGSTFTGEGVYVTIDGGLHWSGTDTLNGAALSNHFGNPSPVIDRYGKFILTHLGGSGIGLYSNVSTDYGVTWSNNDTIIAGGGNSKNRSASDYVPSSPYYGRTYTVWSSSASGSPIRFSYTTNSGTSWSTQISISPPSPPSHFQTGADLECGPDGTIYVVWANAINGSYDQTEDALGFAKSSDGGVTWNLQNNSVYDLNGIGISSTGIFGSYGMQVNGFPRISIDKSGGPRNGWIYVVTSEKSPLSPAQDASDIIMHRSADGGVTWSNGIRVNQDAPGNGKLQFFSAIRVDEFGGVNVVYFDNRNTASDSAEVYLSRSADGGDHWVDVLVSDHRFRPKVVPNYPSMFANYGGDHIGITSGNFKIWPLWMDPSTGIHQAWTTSIELNPTILQNPVCNTDDLAGPYSIKCRIIIAGSAIDPSKTKVYWSRNNPTLTDTAAMINVSGEDWIGLIPGNGVPSTYRYYIKTIDSGGHASTAPVNAPDDLFQFQTSADITPPVITHSPLSNVYINNWPSVVTAIVVDNSSCGEVNGLDSAWVNWYRNDPGTGIKHFKLINYTGNIFTAPFNSDTTQVVFNDSIYYRIFAEDNSINHNRDSSTLNSFKILAAAYSCIGNDRAPVIWPFPSQYRQSRTDMLYKASEIVASGGRPGNIRKIGFNVFENASVFISNFNLKLQTTSLDTLSGFASSGWSTGFNGSFYIPGTGIQYIDLQTPFYWDGAHNLLLEICYTDSLSYSNSTVNADSIPKMTWHQHSTSTTGTGCIDLDSGTAQTYRPNICLIIDSLVMVSSKNNGNEIPKIYTLSQNYPNPFNPTTKITFGLPKSVFVNIVVYDLLGRLVKTLVNEMKPAGVYYVNFNGSELASGVYFYKIEAGEFKSIKKMVLIK